MPKRWNFEIVLQKNPESQNFFRLCVPIFVMDVCFPERWVNTVTTTLSTVHKTESRKRNNITHIVEIRFSYTRCIDANT